MPSWRVSSMPPLTYAKKFFNEMSTSDVRYHNVATHEDLFEVMGMMK